MPSISFGSVDVPADLLAAVNLMAFPEIPGYLAQFGFEAEDARKWREPGAVDLDAQITHHSEQQGHTWYSIRCVLSSTGAGSQDRREWTVTRRLEHIRVHLYGRVCQDLGSEVYEERFAAAPFARRFGLPGTSARVGTWLSTLSGHVSSGKVPPMVAAQLLRFLAAPGPDAGAASPDSAAVQVFGRRAEEAARSSPPEVSMDKKLFGHFLIDNRHEIDISTFNPQGLSTGNRRGGS